MARDLAAALGEPYCNVHGQKICSGHTLCYWCELLLQVKHKQIKEEVRQEKEAKKLQRKHNFRKIKP